MLLLKQFLMSKLGNSYSGEFVSKEKWNWYDFEDIKEYQKWDSIKQINWKLSAKYDKLFTNLYKIEKDLNVNLIIDNNYNLNFFYGLFLKFRKMFLYLKYELGFSFNLYLFNKSWKLIKVGETLFPEKIPLNKKNCFRLSDIKNLKNLVILSDLLFVETDYKIMNSYIWYFPIKKIFKEKNFPMYNWYFNSPEDFWYFYDKKVWKLSNWNFLEEII